jgi:hypothetical protein
VSSQMRRQRSQLRPSWPSIMIPTFAIFSIVTGS